MSTVCPTFWTYYGHQSFLLDTFWHKVSKICPNKLEVWTLLGHKQLCWTHFGHELDTFCQKVSKELGLDTSLDTFWTPRAKMCPKSVRPYIVQEHPESDDVLPKSNSLQAADRPHRPPPNMSRVLAEQKHPCRTIFACAEGPPMNTVSHYVNHYEALRYEVYKVIFRRKPRQTEIFYIRDRHPF